MKVPLVDLQAQYRPIKGEVLARISEVLDGMNLTLGTNVQSFEREFASATGVEQAIAVSDGTTALQLALMACGIGQQDEVITVSHTFVATVEAIALVGARPVFVDIDPLTYTIDVGQIERHITPRTRAILPVHLYGQPADMDPILEIARRKGLWVIEDACQAHGARYKGRPVGGLGHLAAYSFYCSKNLGAYGECGMVTTNDAELAHRVRLLRDHGSPSRYHHDLIGMNGRPDEIQAAVLRVKLPHLQRWNAQRRAHAERYGALLQAVPSVTPPFVAGYAEPVFHLYVVRAPQRDALVRYLQERGVGAGVHYPIPCHLQRGLAGLGYRPGDLPATEQAAQEVLSLPMYAELAAEQQDYVVGCLHEFYQAQPAALAAQPLREEQR